VTVQEHFIAYCRCREAVKLLRIELCVLVHLAQDRYQWLGFKNMAMKFGVIGRYETSPFFWIWSVYEAVSC
jgi:hypothetical protein